MKRLKCVTGDSLHLFFSFHFISVVQMQMSPSSFGEHTRYKENEFTSVFVLTSVDNRISQRVYTVHNCAQVCSILLYCHSTVNGSLQLGNEASICFWKKHIPFLNYQIKDHSASTAVVTAVNEPCSVMMPGYNR